jgi:hypothetical protein
MTWKIALPMYNLSPQLASGVGGSCLARCSMSWICRWRWSCCTRRQLCRRSGERPDLLLAQTCGYPYVTLLRGQVTLVATPCFDFPGCAGSDYSSVIVAGSSAPASPAWPVRAAVSPRSTTPTPTAA